MFQRHHDLFNFSPIPMWVYHVRSLEILAANEAACRDYGYSLAEFLSETIDILLPPSDRSRSALMAQISAKKGISNKLQAKHITKHGKLLDVDVTSEPTWDENTRIVVAIDVSEKQRATAAERRFNELNQLERNILELHSKTYVTTTKVLTSYLLGLEQLLPEIACTIMQVRHQTIYNWASPSLSPQLIAAFNGVEIGPNVGSCGTAAYLKQKVIVADILESEYWELYKDITLEAGFRACWSYPVIDSANRVMGTFALYQQQPGTPNKQEEQLIERAISLLTVILENRQYAAMLTENSELMKQGQALARFGNWSWEIKDNLVSWSDELYEIYGIKKAEFLATFEGYLQLLHAEDRQRITATIYNVLETKVATDFEERIIRPTGEVRYLRSWATLKCDEHGEPVKMIGACLDITESKHILQELSANEARLRNLVEAQTNYVMRIDAIGFYTYYNNKFKQDFGWIYGSGDFTGADATLSVIPELRDSVVKATFKCLENPGEVIEIELIHPTQHGAFKTSFWHMVALIGENGAKPEIQCIGIDVTEKVVAQAALVKSETRFKKLIQEGSDLISIFDAEGIFKYLSPTAERVLGYTMNELLGENVYHLIHEDDRDAVEAIFLQLKDKKRIELAPFRMRCKNREIRWVETIATDLTDDAAVGGIVANARDVTQRVMDELANKEHLERYNIVAKATSDTIWDCNLLTDEVSWNHGIKNVFGYDSATTNYDWWHGRVHPDDVGDVKALITTSKEQKNHRWSSEYRFRCADGSYKVVFDRGFLIFNDDGQPIRMIGAMQDVTERVKYVQEIELHNSRLKDIAWKQSHMVRGPLTRIMGLIPLFADPDLDDDARQLALDYLKTSAEQLDGAVRDIVDKSQ